MKGRERLDGDGRRATGDGYGVEPISQSYRSAGGSRDLNQSKSINTTLQNDDSVPASVAELVYTPSSV